jgi:hypothetical protein
MFILGGIQSKLARESIAVLVVNICLSDENNEKECWASSRKLSPPINRLHCVAKGDIVMNGIAQVQS